MPKKKVKREETKVSTDNPLDTSELTSAQFKQLLNFILANYNGKQSCLTAEKLEELISHLNNCGPEHGGRFYKKIWSKEIMNIKRSDVESLNELQLAIKTKFESKPLASETSMHLRILLNPNKKFNCSFRPEFNLLRHPSRSDDFNEIFPILPWIGTYPIPLYTETSIDAIIPDKVMELIKMKSDYLAKLKSRKCQYFKTLNKKGVKPSKSMYSHDVVKYAELLMLDPDPYFSKNLIYDFYFTGNGSINLIAGKITYIVHVVGMDLDIVEIIPCEIFEGISLDFDQKTIILSDQKSVIYEIFHSKSIENEMLIGFRRKTTIQIYRCTDEFKMTFETTTFESEIPFISGLLLNAKDILITADLEKNIEFFDLQNDTRIYEFNIKKLDRHEDGLVILQQFGQENLLIADRGVVYLYKMDILSPKCSCLSLTSQFEIKGHVDSCESICQIICSLFGNLVYIATTHKLLAVKISDVDCSFSVEIIWTHNMIIPPIYIDTHTYGYQNELVVLGNSFMRGYIICMTTANYDEHGIISNYVSNYFPFKPYNIIDSVNLAHKMGQCLNARSSLNQRITYSYIGGLLVETSSKMIMLTKSSLGDIYQQEIVQKSNFDSSNIPNIINEWMENFLLTDSTFEATDFLNMESMRAVLDCENLDQEPEEIDIEITRRRRKWQQTISELSKYKDMLAPSMFAVWGFNPETAEVDIQILGSTDHKRTLEWVNSTTVSTNELNTMGSLLMDSAFSSTQQTNDDTTQMTATTSQIVKPPKKKKKTYVQGF